MTDPIALDPTGWHTVRIRVRYGETDQMGVVYHGNYLLYFEECRTAFLRALGAPYVDVEAGGVNLAVVDIRMRLRGPARYDNVLAVRCRVKLLSYAKLTIEYEIRRDGEEGGPVLTTGETTLAAVSRATGKPVRLPDAMRQLLRGAADKAGVSREAFTD